MRSLGSVNRQRYYRISFPSFSERCDITRMSEEYRIYMQMQSTIAHYRIIAQCRITHRRLSWVRAARGSTRSLSDATCREPDLNIAKREE